MPFTLRITFGGLCLFVPDRQQELVHVLMPGAHHGPRHDTFLLQDPRFRTGDNSPVDRDFHRVDLRNFSLTLDLGSAAPVVPLEIVSLRDTSNIPDLTMTAAFVGSPVDAKVASRISLRGGKLEARGGSGCTVEGTGARLAGLVDWVVELDRSSLSGLGLNSLRNADKQPLSDLRPIKEGGDDTIWLPIVHVQPQSVPRSLAVYRNLPADDLSSDHYDHYFVYWDDVIPNPPRCVSPGASEMRGMFPRVCLTATVPLE